LTRINFFDRWTRLARAASIWVAAGFVPFLSSCALLREWSDPTTVSIRGVPPTLEQLNVVATAHDQDLLITDLIREAGLSAPPSTPDGNWDLVMRAGVYEIGRQCDQYLDVLFRFNREQRAGRQDLAAAAAATGAIMGLSGVSVKAIAITAAAFGLASSLFDASVNSVLFTIEPSALRNVALQGRKKYLDDLKNNNVKINTRPDMLIALQGYLTQCSPAAIEANINNAASGAPSVAVPDTEKPDEAAVLAAPATVLLKKSGPAALTPQAPPKSGTDTAALTATPDSRITGALSQFEQTLSQRRGQKIEQGLCLAPEALGKVAFGSNVRQAIGLFRTTTTGQTVGANPPVRPGDGLTRNEGNVLERVSPCPGQCYKNAFEYFQYGPDAGMGPDLARNPKGPQRALSALAQSLAWATGDPQAAALTDFCVPATRNLIDRAMKSEKLPVADRLDAKSPAKPLTRSFVDLLRGMREPNPGPGSAAPAAPNPGPGSAAPVEHQEPAPK